MVADQLLPSKWGATPPLETDFPKIPYPKSDPMHLFLTQPTRRMGQNQAFGIKFGANSVRFSPMMRPPKTGSHGSIASGEILGRMKTALGRRT